MEEFSKPKGLNQKESRLYTAVTAVRDNYSTTMLIATNGVTSLNGPFSRSGHTVRKYTVGFPKQINGPRTSPARLSKNKMGSLDP